MKKHVEEYWAVKIGEHPENQPYFMINELDTEVPAIFQNSRMAENEARRRSHGGKVVKVKITEL